ncbi:MAG TPA: hypothetical protein VF260_07190 [Bacilli bacterium]
MNLKDTLFNWLQMKIVADGRPDDRSAKDTLDFFADMLATDHHLTQVAVTGVFDSYFHVEYVENGEKKTMKFRRELAEKLLADINSNPKYNNQ